MVKQDLKRNLRMASDSLTRANVNNPWIQRYLQGNALNIPDPYNPGSGKTSTHGLSYHPTGNNQAMIFPEIIQRGDSLVHMSNDAAREYAMKNKTGITTDLELAKYYSKDGLIDHTKFAQGGQVSQYGVGGDVAMDASQGALGGAALGLPGIIGGALMGGIGGFLGARKEEDLLQQQSIGNNPMMGASNIPTFCRGGKIKKYPKGGYTVPGTAELEQGEVFMTPDGNVQRITDSAPRHGQKAKSGRTGVRMDLPGGTKILSNRNIDPMTGKTFADAAAKDSKLRDKAIKALRDGKSKYAKAAAERNLANLDKAFNTAFDRQEFGKGGTTGGTQQYQGGGEFPGGTADYFARHFGTNILTGQEMSGPFPQAQGNFPFSGMPQAGWAQYGGQGQPGGTGGGTAAGAGVDPSLAQGDIFRGIDGMFGSAAGAGFDKVGQSLVGQGDPTQITGAGAGIAGAVPGSTGAGLGFGQKLWQGLGGAKGILGGAAALAPSIYNLIQGARGPEQRDPSQFRNPQYSQAINLMANRRFDVDPLLEANRSAAAIGRYNLGASGASAGQQFAGYQGLAANRMRADQAALAQKTNVDNQYLAQEAQMRAGLGSEEARNLWRTDQDNLAAQAMGRTFTGAGLGQISQYSQMQQLMTGQRGRDEMLIDVLRTNPRAAQWLNLPQV